MPISTMAERHKGAAGLRPHPGQRRPGMGTGSHQQIRGQVDILVD